MAIVDTSLQTQFATKKIKRLARRIQEDSARLASEHDILLKKYHTAGAFPGFYDKLLEHAQRAARLTLELQKLQPLLEQLEN
jgi:hypothetical protein